jgi:hypothetical protein
MLCTICSQQRGNSSLLLRLNWLKMCHLFIFIWRQVTDECMGAHTKLSSQPDIAMGCTSVVFQTHCRRCCYCDVWCATPMLGCQVFAVIIDFSNAFNRVNNQKLLHELNEVGVHAGVVRLLTNRYRNQQAVVLRNNIIALHISSVLRMVRDQGVCCHHGSSRVSSGVCYGTCGW